MALWWDRQVSSLIVPGIKRTHPTGRREFPWGVPRPYAWQPTFLGAVDEVTRFKWEQRIEQGLNTILARMEASVGTGAMAATKTTDTAAASRSFAGTPSTAKGIAKVLRAMFPPSGVPDVGWKEVDRKLRASGVYTKRPTFYRARKINVSDQSQP
jgi:hypothetical protein